MGCCFGWSGLDGLRRHAVIDGEEKTARRCIGHRLWRVGDRSKAAVGLAAWVFLPGGFGSRRHDGRWPGSARIAGWDGDISRSRRADDPDPQSRAESGRIDGSVWQEEPSAGEHRFDEALRRRQQPDTGIGWHDDGRLRHAGQEAGASVHEFGWHVSQLCRRSDSVGKLVDVRGDGAAGWSRGRGAEVRCSSRPWLGVRGSGLE